MVCQGGRADRSHDGRDDCAGWARGWCGRTSARGPGGTAGGRIARISCEAAWDREPSPKRSGGPGGGGLAEGARVARWENAMETVPIPG